MGFFNYDESEGLKAGGGGITESGAYIGELSAICIEAGTGSKGIEFTLTTPNGQARYLSVYYQKSDGSKTVGSKLINAMMGLLRIPTLTTVKTHIDGAPAIVVPEFEGKEIGLVLQKVLYTKNDGGEGYKFEIKMPFSAKTSQTLKEALENESAKTVEKITSSLKDRDDRDKGGKAKSEGIDRYQDYANQNDKNSYMNSGMSDDVPF